jgi:hypothetical protein
MPIESEGFANTTVNVDAGTVYYCTVSRYLDQPAVGGSSIAAVCRSTLLGSVVFWVLRCIFFFNFLMPTSEGQFRHIMT